MTWIYDQQLYSTNLPSFLMKHSFIFNDWGPLITKEEFLIIYPRNFFCVDWYQNLRFEICCISKYLQEYYNTVYMMYTLSLFCTLRSLYQVIFQRKVSSKNNCNRDCWGWPSGWNWLIVVIFSTSTWCVLPYKATKQIQLAIP